LKRGVVLAMVIGLGNLGGICSSFIYLARESPRYPTGHSTVIGSCGMAIIFTAILMVEFSRLNKRKAERCAREGITEARAAEFGEMGDASPLFRYIL